MGEPETIKSFFKVGKKKKKCFSFSVTALVLCSQDYTEN